MDEAEIARRTGRLRELAMTREPAAPPRDPPAVAPAHAPRRRAGRVELALRKDIKALGATAGSRATLGELALVLARAIDGQGEGAAPTAVAKLVQELRAVMAALGEATGDGDDDAEFASDMSTPVRDAPQP